MKNPPQCHHCFPGRFLQLLYFPKVRHLNPDLYCVRQCMFRCLGQRGTAGICLSLWLSLGAVMLPFRDRPHLLCYQGYWQAELHRGRKAHPSSKHSNLTTTKSSAKINSHQMGGKVLCQGRRCSQLSRAQATYTWVCASHAGKPPPLWGFAKPREQDAK